MTDELNEQKVFETADAAVEKEDVKTKKGKGGKGKNKKTEIKPVETQVSERGLNDVSEAASNAMHTEEPVESVSEADGQVGWESVIDGKTADCAKVEELRSSDLAASDIAATAESSAVTEAAYAEAAQTIAEGVVDEKKHFKPLKTKRGVIKLFFLSLITLGIYGLVFWSRVAKDVNSVCAYDGKKTRGIWFLLFISLITAGIYAVVWNFKLASRIIDGAGHYSVTADLSMSSYVLWCILGLFIAIGPIIGTALLFKTLNKICAAYNTIEGTDTREFLDAEIEE